MRLYLLSAAFALFTAVAVAEPAPEAVLRKEAGNLFLKNRQFQQARDQYLAALQLDPAFSDAHYNLGIVYFFRLEDYPRALYHLSRYAKLKPDAPDLDQVRALSEQALQKIETTERAIYQDALDEGTIEALRSFSAAHADSYYARDAEQKILLLEEYEKERQRQHQTLLDAYERALNRATPEAMDEFIAVYPTAPQVGEARQLRDFWAEQRKREERAFLAATEDGSRLAMEQFLEQYPQSPYATEARSRLLKLEGVEEAYQTAVNLKSIAALEEFRSTYPTAPQAADAERLIRALEQQEQLRTEAETAFRAAAESRTAAALEAFLAAYPGSVHTRDAEMLLETVRYEESERARQEDEQRQDEAYRLAVDLRTVEALENFLKTYPESRYRSDAEELVAILQREAEERARREAELEEERAYWRALDARDLSALETFLNDYPHSRFADEATRARDSLIRERDADREREQQLPHEAAQPDPETKATKPGDGPSELGTPEEDPHGTTWEGVRERDTVEGYREFIEKHPEAEEVEAARSRINELENSSREPSSNLSRSKRRALDRYRQMLLDP